MPISGYILWCEPGATGALAERLSRVKGVELGDRQGDGLALAVETASDELSRAFEASVEALPGARSLQLIYHNFEDDPAVALRSDGAGANGGREGERGNCHGL